MLLLLESRLSGSRSGPNVRVGSMLTYGQMLHRLQLIDSVRCRQYLLDKVQHIVGGFGKGIGEPPGKPHDPQMEQSCAVC